MSYMIQYEGNIEEKFAETVKKVQGIKRILAPCSIAIIVIIFLIQPLRTAIVDFLFPGDSAFTFEAGERMIEDIKDGKTFKDAFADFCIEIVENA